MNHLAVFAGLDLRLEVGLGQLVVRDLDTKARHNLPPTKVGWKASSTAPNG
jgi:hypothetical protein